MILDGYTLHSGIIWENEFTRAAASQDIEYTLLNNVVIHSIPDTLNEFVISSADRGSGSRGYFSRDQIVHFRSLEQSATEIVLKYRGISYNVIIKAGSIKVKPKRETESVSDSDIYTGSITLIEVGS